MGVRVDIRYTQEFSLRAGRYALKAVAARQRRSDDQKSYVPPEISTIVTKHFVVIEVQSTTQSTTHCNTARFRCFKMAPTIVI